MRRLYLLLLEKLIEIYGVLIALVVDIVRDLVVNQINSHTHRHV